MTKKHASVREKERERRKPGSVGQFGRRPDSADRDHPQAEHAGPTAGLPGTSPTLQAAHLGDPEWQSAQRHALVDQLERTQGNRQVQRLIDAAQLQRQEAKSFTKRDVKDVLNTILGLEWMGQSGGTKPIQLTSRLLAVLQVATSLSGEDLKLLWREPPKTPGEALRNLDASLPATVSAELMQRLQEAKSGLVVGGRAPKAAQTNVPAAAATETPKALAGVEGKEALIKAIVGALQGKEPEDKDQGTEAVKKNLEAFFATGLGKKIKKEALQFLLKGKGLPLTILVGTGALAAMVANNTDLPSTPDIDLSDEWSIKVEFEGTFQQPTGIKLLATWKFGGPAKETRGGKETTVLALPPAMQAEIGRINKNLLVEWIVQRAAYEYEIAGPDEEEAKRQFYLSARDRPHDAGLPDAQDMAQDLARRLVEGAVQNRINQLEGKEVQKRITFDTKRGDIWNRFFALDGLMPRLQAMLNQLLPRVPYKAVGIEQVTFVCGNKLIPIQIKR